MNFLRGKSEKSVPLPPPPTTPRSGDFSHDHLVAEGSVVARSPSFIDHMNPNQAPMTPRRSPRESLASDPKSSPRNLSTMGSASLFVDNTRSRVASVIDDVGNLFGKKGDVLHTSRAKSTSGVSTQYTEDPRTGLPIVTIPPALIPPKCSLDGALVHFFDKVKKVNRKGVEQERLLCISATMVHTVDPKTGVVARCFPVLEIQEMVYDVSCGIIALVVPSEYDVAFRTPKHKDIVDIITTISNKISTVPVVLTKMSLATTQDINIRLHLDKQKDFVQRTDPVPTVEDIDDWYETAKKLAMKSVTIESLNQEIQELKQKNAQLEAALKKTKFSADASDTFKAEVEQFTKTFANLPWEVDGVQSLMNASDEILSNVVMSELLSTLVQKITYMQTRNIEEQSAELRRVLKWSFDQSILSLCKQSVESRDIMKKTTKTVEEYLRTLKEKESSAAGNAATAEELKRVQIELEDTIKDLRRQIQDQAGDHARSVEELKKLQQNEALGEKEIIAKERDALKLETAALKEELLVLKRTLEEERVQHKTLREEYEELAGREGKREPTYLEMRCRTLEQDNIIKTSDLLVLKEQYQLLEKQLEDCYDEITSMKHKTSMSPRGSMRRGQSFLSARLNSTVNTTNSAPVHLSPERAKSQHQGASPNNTTPQYETWIRNIYKHHHPVGHTKVEDVLSKWRGKEEVLFQTLVQRYGLSEDAVEEVKSGHVKDHKLYSSIAVVTPKDSSASPRRDKGQGWNLRTGQELPNANHLVNYGANLTLARGTRVVVHFERPAVGGGDNVRVESEGTFVEFDQFGFCTVLLPSGTKVEVSSTAMRIL